MPRFSGRPHEDLLEHWKSDCPLRGLPFLLEHADGGLWCASGDGQDFIPRPEAVARHLFKRGMRVRRCELGWASHRTAYPAFDPRRTFEG